MDVKLRVCLFIIAVLFPFTGFSGELSDENEQLFKDFDLNKDDSISVGEAVKDQWLFHQFDKIDVNKDEKLERSEFSAYEPEDRFEPPILDEPGVGAAPLD